MPNCRDSQPPATEELPPDIVIPPRLVVSRKSFEQILDQVENPGQPTEEMKALFARGRSGRTGAPSD